MRKLNLLCYFLLFHSIFFCSRQQTNLPATKRSVLASIDNHEKELIRSQRSRSGHLPKQPCKESQSSKVLADYAEAQGFKVSRGVADMPTAFIAEYGSGKPIIGIMGEYDALPGLSQKAFRRENRLNEGAPGHGCGHNMFGAASLGRCDKHQRIDCVGKIERHDSFLWNACRRRRRRQNLYGQGRLVQRSGCMS